MNEMTRGIPVAYAPPFKPSGAWRCERPEGMTLREIVLSVPGLPSDFMRHGMICVNGEPVSRELWPLVRPKLGTEKLPIHVTLHYPLQGGMFGGGGGGNRGVKGIIGIVAALALVVITAGIAAGFAAPLLGASFAAGQFGALALAGVVGIAGSLAISAPTAPPVTADPGAALGAASDDSNSTNKEAAGAGGNVLAPGGAIPRVLGTRKIFPPFACEPLVELVDDDEVVEGVFVLNGPHELEDIRIDGTSIDDADVEDVEAETREGWDTDEELLSVRRYGRTSTPQIELSKHTLGTDGVELKHSGLPQEDLPIWHSFATKSAPDEIWMHLLFPGGISGGDENRWNVPFRVRLRRRGTSTWFNVPEFHIQGRQITQQRRAILFKWAQSEPLADFTPSEGEGEGGFTYAHVAPPAQDTGPVTPADRLWVASSYFIDNTNADNHWNGSNSATSKVKNMVFYQNRVEIFLSEATFPKGIYEIQVKRGHLFAIDSWNNNASYALNFGSGNEIYDFFWYHNQTNPQLIYNQNQRSDRCALVRVISVWNDYPIKANGFALIGIKAINRNINRLSVIASGYVKDIPGSPDVANWNTWVVTSNPAPHYRDVLTGALNLDPLPLDLLEDTKLLEWRQICVDNNWTIDAVVDDMRTQDVLQLIGSCGYASPYQSDKYSVVIDKDRTGEAPVQLFTRVNSSNFRFDNAFARVPAGLVVTYRDEDTDEDRAQLFVYQQTPSVTDITALESIQVEGLVTEAKVRARAQFDLDQVNLRSVFYTLETDAEILVCRRGDLVAVQHDVIDRFAGDAHVVSKTLGSPSNQIIGFVLDAQLPVINEPDMHAMTDMHTVVDMHNVGIVTGIAIRRNTGAITTHQLSNVTGDTNTITLVTSITDDGSIEGLATTGREYGTLIACGALASEYKRLIVTSITYTKDLKATVALVDEAPELLRFNQVDEEEEESETEDRDEVFDEPGNYTFTVPAGISSLVIEAWGAGGAGSGTLTNAPGGGGGGGYSRATKTVTQGQTVWFQVGAGGQGSNGAGEGGGNSWVNVLNSDTPGGSSEGIFVTGGGGGAGSSGGAGGAGTFGSTNFNGGNGAAGQLSPNSGGGGGGGAGAGGNGGNGQTPAQGANGGAGGASFSPDYGGGGGAGGAVHAPGNPPGGGGGGHRSGGFGGAGADGRVRISW